MCSVCEVWSKISVGYHLGPSSTLYDTIRSVSVYVCVYIFAEEEGAISYRSGNVNHTYISLYDPTHCGCVFMIVFEPFCMLWQCTHNYMKCYYMTTL